MERPYKERTLRVGFVRFSTRVRDHFFSKASKSALVPTEQVIKQPECVVDH